VRKVVLDTNLYIDWLNRGRREALFTGSGYARYLSAVVHLELRAGARTRRAIRGVEQLAAAYRTGKRLFAPGPPIFEHAGRVLPALQDRGWEIRRASLVNDVLIALSARSIGAALYTTNEADFVAIRELAPFELVVVD
jgi:predicted nucleic acid-binding protein